jgi:hypothetical protein
MFLLYIFYTSLDIYTGISVSSISSTLWFQMPVISFPLQKNSISIDLHKIMVITVVSYMFISFGRSASRTKLRS